MTADADDPRLLHEDEHERIRAQLTRRINATDRPSHLINQIAAADLRCAQTTRALSQLMGRSPRVLKVIRAELRKAFGVDPDALLFTVPKPPAPAREVRSLTDWALILLVLPHVPINLNQFTALSLKGGGSHGLSYRPREILERINEMALLNRLASAVDAYWQRLASGHWRTRKEQWAVLHARLFADRALLAYQLGEISAAGLATLSALADAPTVEARVRAAGHWAGVQASRLMWPGQRGTPLPIPGALHIYRGAGAGDTPHLVYLPALERTFYEFPSWDALQCGVLALARGPLSSDVWQCLSVRHRNEACRPADLQPKDLVARSPELVGDALAFSALTLLEGQWDNELACALLINLSQLFPDRQPPPPPVQDISRFLAEIESRRALLVGRARLGFVRDSLLKWDKQRRAPEIFFGSLAPDQPIRIVEQQLKRYEKGLVALMNSSDSTGQTPAFEAYAELERQWQSQVDTLRELTQAPPQSLVQRAFWSEPPPGQTRKRLALMVSARTQALRCEAQRQHSLKLIRTTHLNLLVEILDKPLATERAGSDTCVLLVSVGGEAGRFYPLNGVFAVSRIQVLQTPARRTPVVLSVGGEYGGVQAFDSLDALSKGLRASLTSRDDSVMWHCIGRDQRVAARAMLRAMAKPDTLEVRYTPYDGNVLLHLYNALIKSHVQLYNAISDNVGPFSAVSDPGLARLMLAEEWAQHLRVPDNQALRQARANLDFVQLAARQAEKMPAWLGTTHTAQRKAYRRLHQRYMSSAVALESRLGQVLPDLNTYARRQLIERLRGDGFYPQLDIDAPLLNMPDDVAGRNCVWESQCVVGDRNEIRTSSPERTTFSMLELALHNLDPHAVYSRWRLNRAIYLMPAWREKLSASYLIRTVSALDIGGTYDEVINRTFYPPRATQAPFPHGRIAALTHRTLLERAHVQLFSAAQQGLSANAQSIFNTALAAQAPGDLRANGHRLRLYFVNLVGRTLLHDRHIAGLLVIHDQATGLCVVYWPAASDAQVITEYGSVQHAHEQLNRIAASDSHVKLLAQHVAPGWASEAISTYPHHAEASQKRPTVLIFLAARWLLGRYLAVPRIIRYFKVKHEVPTAFVDLIELQIKEQIADEPTHWLAFEPTLHSHTLDVLAHDRVLAMKRETQACSNSSKTLEKYRINRLKQQSDAALRGLLAYVPLVSLAVGALDVLSAARRYHHGRDPKDLVDIVFLTFFLLIDMAMTFLPGGKVKGGGSVPRFTTHGALPRLHHRVGLRGGALSYKHKMPSALPNKLMERYRRNGVPEDAIEVNALGGEGVFVKNGEQFVADDTHHYPVYRREGEQVLRLKNLDHPEQDELILNIHQSREWLLGADAPEPVPGPSSGVLRPWRSLESKAGWSPPVSRTVTERTVLQSPQPSNYWLNWSAPVTSDQLLNTATPGVYHVPLTPPRFPFEVVYLGGTYFGVLDSGTGYYRILPPGANAPLSRISFITRNELAVSLASVDVERWTSTALGEQPIPVSPGPNNRWRLHRPLFDRPLEQFLDIAFPTMTADSKRFAIQRLIELSDPQRSVTASHLLNVKATLDDWLTPSPLQPGQTDDLLRMLRPQHKTSATRLFIGYEGKAPGFARVDFTPPYPLNPELKTGGGVRVVQRKDAQRAAIRNILEGQGFEVRELVITRSRHTDVELVCTHPRSDNLYYMATQWLEKPSIVMGEKFSERWFRQGNKSNVSPTLLADVEEARREKRLVPMVGGIQWQKQGRLPPTVYFVKVSLLTP
ncbi:dermonecrotic toxin domain-containing protein [Pseudomonas poae]|uniref:Dermonecrotic toxin N-terminal domain-containing protein n=1 Tax=Pseudomonas poae TaxID=200451 RepID=A0A2S9EZV7_9PSED|nr:DUF6543 domain-containing protein [Pseudomonas poae]PRA31385.1 hypothetical protein CQZ97_08110 [Pseudomonas poae]PRC22991.1 hypothetical protein CQZ99_01010 [Pseudomonas poae]